ncbi:MAG: hypothetical protein HYV63_14465 [Candidatus Schekmanbacteria bacterium]|nr:hypothetical protein [Candidatus Schekmanbacteria bacterium]
MTRSILDAARLARLARLALLALILAQVAEVAAVAGSPPRIEATWSQVGLDGLSIRCLLGDPANRAGLVAGTLENPVFLTADGGDSWFAAGQTLTASNIQALAFDPLAGTTVYAGTAAAGIFKSTDFGATWVSASGGIGNAGVSALAVDPRQPATVYAGTSAGPVFRSTDAGESWAASGDGLEDGEVTALVIDPAANQIVYAATRYAAGAYRSTDGGGSWSASSSGLANAFVSALVMDPVAPLVLYAGTDTGIFKTTDGGLIWAASSAGLETLHVQALAVDPAQHQVVYAGTEFGGVFSSADSGATWLHSSSGLAHASVESLVVDPVDGRTVWAGTRGGGVYRRIADPPATPTPTPLATSTPTATPTPPLAQGWRRFGPWFGDEPGPVDGSGHFWHEAGFDDHDWQEVAAAAAGGAANLPLIEQGTDHGFNDRYLRGSFAWDGITALWAELASDDGLSVYINGSLLGSWGRWREPGCVNLSAVCSVNAVVPPQAIPAELLLVGQNTIAVDLSNGGGPDYRLYVGITARPSVPAASSVAATVVTSAMLGGRWLVFRRRRAKRVAGRRSLVGSSPWCSPSIRG